MYKLPLAIFFALALCPVCFSQNQIGNQASALSPVLTGDVTPVIEKKEDAAVTVETDKPAYFGGETIKFNITLTNTGEKTFTILRGAVEKFYYIEVTGPNGKRVPQQSPRGALLRGDAYTVELYDVSPKQSKGAVVWLTNLFDMSAPGSYKVTAQTYFRLSTTGKPLTLIKSAPMIVQIKSIPPISEWQ